MPASSWQVLTHRAKAIGFYNASDYGDPRNVLVTRPTTFKPWPTRRADTRCQLGSSTGHRYKYGWILAMARSTYHCFSPTGAT